jgi:hypothetical protein
VKKCGTCIKKRAFLDEKKFRDQKPPFSGKSPKPFFKLALMEYFVNFTLPATLGPFKKLYIACNSGPI